MFSSEDRKNVYNNISNFFAFLEIFNVSKLCIIFAGISIIVTLIISLYWSYKVSFDTQIMRGIQMQCDVDEVMEEETFRYQLYNKTLKEWYTIYQNIPLYAAFAFSGFALLIIVLNSKKERQNYDNEFKIFVLWILSIALYINVTYNTPDLINWKYGNEYKIVLKELTNIINKSYRSSENSTEYFFIEKGFRDNGTQKGYKISEEFINAFMERWKSKYRKDDMLDKYNEVLYTNIDNLKDIESVLFKTDMSNKIVGFSDKGAEILLRMCRPEKSVFRKNNNIVRTHDLDLLYESYITWACLHTTDAELKIDCEYLSKKIKHLPELSQFDTYDKIQQKLLFFKVCSWGVLIAIIYIVFHSIYDNEELIQKILIIFVLLIIIVFFYYILVLRLQI